MATPSSGTRLQAAASIWTTSDSNTITGDTVSDGLYGLYMEVWNLFTGQVVYDNQTGADDFADPTTVIGGGSIIIRKG